MTEQYNAHKQGQLDTIAQDGAPHVQLTPPPLASPLTSLHITSPSATQEILLSNVTWRHLWCFALKTLPHFSPPLHLIPQSLDTDSCLAVRLFHLPLNPWLHRFYFSLLLPTQQHLLPTAASMAQRKAAEGHRQSMALVKWKHLLSKPPTFQIKSLSIQANWFFP